MRAFFLAWALVGAAIVGLMLIVTPALPYYQKLERIRENQATTNSVQIDGANCDSRGFVYDVAGTSYRWRRTFQGGLARAGDQLDASPAADGNCNQTPIIIFYEKSNPANSIASNPDNVFWNDVITMLLVVLIFPPSIVWGFREWRARGMPWRSGWI